MNNSSILTSFEGEMRYNCSSINANVPKVQLTPRHVLTTRKASSKMATSDFIPNTVEIPLTQGFVSIVDEIDSDLKSLRWYVSSPAHPYAVRKRKYISLHRTVMSRVLGREITNNEIVDHINGNTLDNHRGNLRLATPSENTVNSRFRITNTSGYRGVTRHKCGKWQAYIKKNGNNYYLGLFDDPREASEVYKAKAIELYGEFVRVE